MLRFPECVVRVVPVIFALALAPIALPSGAQATAMFSGSATVTLTLTGIENADPFSTTPLDVEVLAGTASTDPFGGDTFPFEFSEGAATTSATSTGTPALTPPDFDDPTVLGIGDSLTITATGSGTADPAGYADVFSASFGLVLIDNFSTTDDVIVSFMLEFSLAAEASVDDPLIEDALSGGAVNVFSFGGDVDVDEFVEADGLFGPPDSAFADSFAFSMTVFADDFDGIDLVVDAGGFAEAIPAPGGFVFLVAGLLAIRLRRA
tara:strand:- start:127 stop:918 length:792 start_codon:yes stop_codon:yes gene_type:complete